MRISLFIPLYNSEKYIQETLESIFAQSYEKYKILLVDDHSTDDTWDIIQSIAGKRNNITIVKNRYEKGISGTTNTALDLVNTEFIAYLDHDDISLPDRFIKQITYMDNNPEVGVCGSWMKEFGSGNNVWNLPSEHHELEAITLLHSPIPNSTAMIRRSVLVSNSIRYNSEFDIAQDYEFWLQLIKHTKFHVLQEILVMHRIHEKNASQTFAEQQYQAWKSAIKPQIQKLGIEDPEELYRIIYQMKYPDFYKFYESERNKVDTMIGNILDANVGNIAFPQKELEEMFLKKKAAWSNKIESS